MNHENRITAEGLREAARRAQVSREIPAWQLAPRRPRPAHRAPRSGMTVLEGALVLAGALTLIIAALT